MKKNIKINIIVQTLFVVSTIITVLIVYNIIEVPFPLQFIVSYVVFLLIYSVYLFVKFIFNAKKLKWIGLKKRFFKFIAYFVLFSAINYIANYFFRPANILSGFTIALGLSFGISFYDLMFYKKE